MREFLKTADSRGTSEEIMEAILFVVGCDEENAAEKFFDFARQSSDSPEEILQIAQDGQQVVVTQQRAGELLAWCESADGWADGPEYARYALLFE